MPEHAAKQGFTRKGAKPGHRRRGRTSASLKTGDRGIYKISKQGGLRLEVCGEAGARGQEDPARITVLRRGN